MPGPTHSPAKPPTDHPTSSMRQTLKDDFQGVDAPKDRNRGHLNSVHDLVLDYLHHNAYAGTAKILAQPRPGRSATSSASLLSIETETPTIREDDTKMEVDVPPAEYVAESSSDAAKKRKDKERLLTADELTSIERRRIVINHILNGAILRAVENLNTYFPDVLDDSKPNESDGYGDSNPYTGGPPYPDNSSSSSTFAQPPKPHFAGYSVEHEYPVYCESCHPSHVKLNLQIQQFIESFRNLAPSSPSTPSSSISSLTSSMQMSVTLPANGANGSSTNGTTNGSNGNHVSSGVTLTNALTAAQGLHAEAKRLPPHVRAVYLQEIKDVGALFAYTEPEKSILSGFLEQTRRIYLADQVNSAILVSEGRPGPSFLYNIAQRTQALYSIARDKRIDVLPPDLDEKTRSDDITTAYWRYQQQAVNKTMTWFRLKNYVRDNWA